MDPNLVFGVAFTLAVLAVCGFWFYRCGHADRARQMRGFARRTFRYAGAGFVLGVAFLTSDLGTPPMGLVAFTACCGLLLYAAGWARIVSDDHTLVLVNLTGRALVLTASELAPFFTLPAPHESAATELPPIVPRTCYVVAPALGRLGAREGRTDIFTVDQSTAKDLGGAGLLLRRLIRAVPL